MSEITKDSIIDFLIKTIQNAGFLDLNELSDEQCLILALIILQSNFSICANKMAKGEPWRL